MKNFVSSKKEKCQGIFSSLKGFYFNEKDSEITKIIKWMSTIAFLIIGYMIIKNLLPIVLGIIIIIWCMKPDNVSFTKNSTPTQEEEIYQESVIAREIVHKCIAKDSDALDLIKPKTVDDITPVRYPVVNYIDGKVFYRFICRYNPDIQLDFSAMEDVIDIDICQLLQCGYPNLNKYPFFYDLPYFSVIDIGFDTYHNGFVYIDIMPVRDANYYNYISKLYHDKHSENMDGVLSAPEDKEF